mmetsp:Transcript_29475/g.40488  ORF Transcript_29475/g.40488 Transcript_29475/m.40488 type:complete len:275 (-) Transcript_29475:710-1534(-)
MVNFEDDVFTKQLNEEVLLNRFCIIDGKESQSANSPYISILNKVHSYIHKTCPNWQFPLATKNIDNESLWEQIHASSNPRIRKMEKNVKKLLQKVNKPETSVTEATSRSENTVSRRDSINTKSEKLESNDRISSKVHFDDEPDENENDENSGDNNSNEEYENSGGDDDEDIEDGEDEDGELNKMDEWLDEMENESDEEVKNNNSELLASIQKELYSDDEDSEGSQDGHLSKKDTAAPYRYEDYFVDTDKVKKAKRRPRPEEEEEEEDRHTCSPV